MSQPIAEGWVRDCFVGIEPARLGLTGPSKVQSVTKLEVGEANLNFLIAASGKKYVFRINAHAGSRPRLGREYAALKCIEHLGIAPKAFYHDDSNRPFGEPYSVLGYIEGIPLSNLESDGISPASTKKLAKLLAGIHSIRAEDLGCELRMRGTSYQGWISHFQRQLKYIMESRKKFSLDGEFDDILRRSVERLAERLPEPPSPSVETVCHADVGAQNIIVGDDGEFRLIDWENFGTWDPAVEISLVFEMFGIDFPARLREPFLKAYLKLRKDPTLRERVEVLRPLVRFEQLTWGVGHIFEILNGEMEMTFVESKDMSKQFSFVKACLKTCEETGIIDSRSSIGELRVFPAPKVTRIS